MQPAFMPYGIIPHCAIYIINPQLLRDAVPV